MADTPDLRNLTDDELTAAFRTAEAEHAAIRAAEPPGSAIVDPENPAVLTEEMRAAAAVPWVLMQAIGAERARRHTRSETDR